MRIQEIREKAATYGLPALTDTELATLIGGRKTQLNEQFAAQITALSERLQSNYQEPIKVSCSRDAFHYIKADFYGLEVEHFYIIMLNRANKIIGKKRISIGGMAGTVVDCKVIFRTMLETPRACSFICVHNHPSGNLNPSQQDIEITRKIKEGAKLLDFSCLDHLIIRAQPIDYFSFPDSGL